MTYSLRFLPEVEEDAMDATGGIGEEIA